MASKYKIEIEAVDKTQKGLKSAANNLKKIEKESAKVGTLGSGGGVTAKGSDKQSQSILAKQEKLVEKQTKAIEKQTKAAEELKKAGENISRSSKSGGMSGRNRGSSVVGGGDDNLSGGLANRISGVAFGIGAAIGIPIGLVNALGKKFEDLVDQQQSYSRLTNGGYVHGQYGQNAAAVSEMHVAAQRRGKDFTPEMARFATNYDLSSDEAATIMATGGSGVTDLGKYGAGMGFKKAEMQSLFKDMSDALTEAVTMGFEISGNELANQCQPLQILL